MLIYGYIPKSKKRKVPKAKQLQYEEWLKSIENIQPKRIISTSKKQSLTGYLPKVPVGRETPNYSSLSTNSGFAAKPAPHVYTGNKVKGIATMHKSNAVPVFTDNEAVEISSMRR